MKLVIAEKPSVAKNIAAVIGAKTQKNGYLEGNGYLVSWCVGHLIELAPPESYDDAYREWKRESLPILPDNWQYEIKEKTQAQYIILESLIQDDRVTSLICATDAGREGELIFRLVYEIACCTKPVERLWISSMEESAIKDGFRNLKPGSDYDSLYESALCRQQADWLVGINGTRFFTALYGGRVLKVGRVQTPTLAMLVDREEQIKNFRKEKYYTAHILMDGMEAATGRIDKKEDAEEITKACKNGQAFVMSTCREEKSILPPKLYDLTTLQRDANRLFGFSAKQTLECAQSLYEKKLATYPRTDSRFLSDDMEQTAKDVVAAVFSSLLFEEPLLFNPNVKNVLDSKKVTDHHAIIPTVEIENADLSTLPDAEHKILSLLANRLLCATGEKHLYDTIKAEFSSNGHTFTLSGKSVTHSGWKDFEKIFQNAFRLSVDKEDGAEKDSKEEETKGAEKTLPKLEKGQTLSITGTSVREHFTSPPGYYTEDSLLLAMEKAGSGDMETDVERKGLGTPATRADIIEKLVKDGYIRRDKRKMIPTADGVRLIAALPDMLKSPKLTADWENALARIAKGELGQLDFMADIKMMISAILNASYEVSDEQRENFALIKESFGVCPHCGGSMVKGKSGAYCDNNCGMSVGRYYTTYFTDGQIKSLLAGKKILLKGLKGKAGKPYSMYLKPMGVESYSYKKDGKDVTGYQFSYEKSYPDEKRK
ncbi:MAG: DNA topoisomerase 3 [Clostridium sp.]|nr:DNA topoisomerase 3 [Lachnoclostridium sp.]MCM1253951.1 DNA topoisomerase 3 [Clostridium sp.]